MNLTLEQVLALAPDASSAAAGRKLASANAWSCLGSNEAAIWGECQGSALYQVRVDLADLTVKCSCPSRKFPCKHGLGLLLVLAQHANAIPKADPPGLSWRWWANPVGSEYSAERYLVQGPGRGTVRSAHDCRPISTSCRCCS